MKSYQAESCNTIAQHYGKDSQVLVAIEEMSELTKELCKYFRRYDRRNEIIEELADAEIMLEQLKCLFDIHTEVSNEIDYKLERQLRRIDQERE